MKVKFKKMHENAVLPSYAKPGDAGMDITAVSDGVFVNSGDAKDQWYYVEYDSGLAVEIPEGFVGLIYPRSSISKSSLHMANSVGVIDAGFRGSISVRFKIDAGIVSQAIAGYTPHIYKKGDRICQLVIMPYPIIEPEFVDTLSDTERGAGGYGSTG